MAYATFDDDFWQNPKLQRLSDRAHRLYVRAIGYSAKWLTDGVLDATALDTLGNPSSRLCAELVNERCWEVIPDGGYQIHDYLVHNLSREQVEERRRQAAARQARKREHANKHPDSGRFTA